MSMSDERLSALIQYGPPWGRWGDAEITEALKGLKAAREALRTVRGILKSDSIEYDDMRNAWETIESVLPTADGEVKS